MNKKIDQKLFTLRILRKWYVVLIGTVVGALLVGGPYTLSKTTLVKPNYIADIKMHIEYVKDADGNDCDYINYYTWTDYVTSDWMMDALGDLDGMTREDVRSSLSAVMEADLRVMDFLVTTKSMEKSNRIRDRLLEVLPEKMVELPEVESTFLITVKDTKADYGFVFIARSFIFGAILGFFFSLWGLWIKTVLDDSVFIPELFAKETGLRILESAQGKEVFIDKALPTLPAEGPVTLSILCNANNGKAIDWAIENLREKGIEVSGVMFRETDRKLYNAYYVATKFPNPFLKADV